ncbi:MAG: hypothetical protein HC913_12170 [Microscillaceae bacterium]|nr:hypothetical protein [Microscillaceae bacterium]
MRSLNFLLALWMLGFVPSGLMAQEGQKFPVLTGRSLVDKNVVLPKTGKVSLVALAYSPNSEDYLKAWRKPLFDLFIKAPGTDLFDFEPYDAQINFVVLLTGAKKVGAGKVFTKLEENVQDHWKEHILVVKGQSLADYEVLDLGKTKNEREKPYFFLMDASGKIVYATSGAYTAAKQTELENKLQALLGDNQFKD